jgi:hypothetical protein
MIAAFRMIARRIKKINELRIVAGWKAKKKSVGV